MAQSQIEGKLNDPDLLTDDESEVPSVGGSEAPGRKAPTRTIANAISLDSEDEDDKHVEESENILDTHKAEDKKTKKGAPSGTKKSFNASKKKVPKRLLELSFPSDSDSTSEFKEIGPKADSPIPSTSGEIGKRKRGRAGAQAVPEVVDSGEEFKPAPVNGEIKAGDVEVVSIIDNQLRFLGTGK